MTEPHDWADRLRGHANADTSSCFGHAGQFEGLAQRAIAEVARSNSPSRAALAAMSAPHVTAVAYALMAPEADAAEDLVEALLDAGLTLDELCFEHLAPAARVLGEMWDKDRLPFTEVTLATGRLQSLLHGLPNARRPGIRYGERGAVFAAVPGETHTVGIVMAADYFRRQGWDVSLLLGLPHADLVGRIAEDDRTIVGLSCSCLKTLPALQRLVSDLRHVRPDLSVVLSGQIAHRDIANIELPLVDALVTDVTKALDVFATLLEDQSDYAVSVRSMRMGSEA